MSEPIYGRKNMPLLRSFDSLAGIVLQICRRCAAESVRSGVLRQSGVGRNIVATPDGRLYLACSGLNKFAIVKASH
jgi:hypothetical protein